MNLFSFDKQLNLLPVDGEVYYFDGVFDKEKANYFYRNLQKTIDWKSDELFIYGRQIITKRKVAWYGDDNCHYTYSNRTKTALPWTNELLQLKEIVEQETETKFNSCLLNLYHDGDEGMAWHSDDEKELGYQPIIASLSLGAERKFVFKHNETQEKVSHVLDSGSLLLMKGDTQQYWQHSLPKTKTVKESRINLTFRRIMNI